MNGFEPVTLSWRGQEYTVPAEDQLMLIGKIEDALGGNAINALLSNGGPGYSRLARAYGSALRHAGASVSDNEVYMSIVQGIADQDMDAVTQVNTHIMNLLAIVAPPVALALMGSDDQKKAPPKAPPKKRKA